MEEFAVVMNLEKRSDLIYDYQKLAFYKIDRLVHHHNFHSVSFSIDYTVSRKANSRLKNSRLSLVVCFSILKKLIFSRKIVVL